MERLNAINELITKHFNLTEKIEECQGITGLYYRSKEKKLLIYDCLFYLRITDKNLNRYELDKINGLRLIKNNEKLINSED